MAAQHEVKLPKLGDMVDSVLVLEWLCSVGDTIDEGAPVIRVETDKVEADVPAPISGRVVEQLVAVDDQVSTGQVICIIESE